MSFIETFIVYLILFRLAIIAAAIICIVLGYRLFVRGVWPQGGTGVGTSVDASIAGSHFTLKNAAPGTCFALFGVLIIAVMFAAGSPQMTLDSLADADSTRQLSGTSLVLRDHIVNEISRNHKRYEGNYIDCDTAYARLYQLVYKK